MKCRPTDIMQAQIDALEDQVAGLRRRNATQERLILRLWRLNTDLRRRLDRAAPRADDRPPRETARDRAEAIFKH